MSNMKKSGKIYRIGALLVVVCLISTVMLSGTFAKYTDSYAGQDTALVARWSFTAEGGQDGALATITADDAQELNLFDHLYNTHINQKAGANQDSRFIIAPGVEGEFTLAMDYLADVDADVEIAFAELEDSVAVPMEYSVDDGDTWVKLEGLAEKYIAEILFEDVITDEDDDNTFRIAAVDPGVTEPVKISKKIEWRWPYDVTDSIYDQTDAADTTLGEASNTAELARTKYGIKVTLTATQVEPSVVVAP